MPRQALIKVKKMLVTVVIEYKYCCDNIEVAHTESKENDEGEYMRILVDGIYLYGIQMNMCPFCGASVVYR